MKNIITTLIVMATFNGYAQNCVDCDVKNQSTDPRNPINCEKQNPDNLTRSNRYL